MSKISEKKLRVLFITNIPSPYRVDFFNELGKKCELTVLFEKKKSDERNDKWKHNSFNEFKGIVLDGISIKSDSALCPSVIKWLRKKWDKIIITNYYTLTGMLAIRYLKLCKIPYYIEGDGAFVKSVVGIKANVKRLFLKGAAGYFSTSKEHDKFYESYGAIPNLIFRYPFSSVHERDIVDHCYDEAEKQKIRKKLNISEKKVILAVGQFIHRKGFDVLIKASYLLSSDYGIYFVGGIPTEEYLNLAKNQNNIHFIGFMPKEELRKYYLATDVFILPTREDIWGLVINEAMSFGLPIITTEKCIAGLELVENRKNGYIVEVDNPEAISRGIEKCFVKDNLYNYGENSLKKIHDYTIEKMAERHMEVLKNE